MSSLDIQFPKKGNKRVLKLDFATPQTFLSSEQKKDSVVFNSNLLDLLQQKKDQKQQSEATSNENTPSNIALADIDPQEILKYCCLDHKSKAIYTCEEESCSAKDKTGCKKCMNIFHYSHKFRILDDDDNDCGKNYIPINLEKQIYQTKTSFMNFQNCLRAQPLDPKAQQNVNVNESVRKSSVQNQKQKITNLNYISSEHDHISKVNNMNKLTSNEDENNQININNKNDNDNDIDNVKYQGGQLINIAKNQSKLTHKNEVQKNKQLPSPHQSVLILGEKAIQKQQVILVNFAADSELTQKNKDKQYQQQNSSKDNNAAIIDKKFQIKEAGQTFSQVSKNLHEHPQIDNGNKNQSQINSTLPQIFNNNNNSQSINQLQNLQNQNQNGLLLQPLQQQNQSALFAQQMLPLVAFYPQQYPQNYYMNMQPQHIIPYSNIQQPNLQHPNMQMFYQNPYFVYQQNHPQIINQQSNNTPQNYLYTQGLPLNNIPQTFNSNQVSPFSQQIIQTQQQNFINPCFSNEFVQFSQQNCNNYQKIPQEVQKQQKDLYQQPQEMNNCIQYQNDQITHTNPQLVLPNEYQQNQSESFQNHTITSNVNIPNKKESQQIECEQKQLISAIAEDRIDLKQNQIHCNEIVLKNDAISIKIEQRETTNSVVECEIQQKKIAKKRIQMKEKDVPLIKSNTLNAQNEKQELFEVNKIKRKQSSLIKQNNAVSKNQGVFPNFPPQEKHKITEQVVLNATYEVSKKYESLNPQNQQIKLEQCVVTPSQFKQCGESSIAFSSGPTSLNSKKSNVQYFIEDKCMKSQYTTLDKIIHQYIDFYPSIAFLNAEKFIQVSLNNFDMKYYLNLLDAKAKRVIQKREISSIFQTQKCSLQFDDNKRIIVQNINNDISAVYERGDNHVDFISNVNLKVIKRIHLYSIQRIVSYNKGRCLAIASLSGLVQQFNINCNKFIVINQFNVRNIPSKSSQLENNENNVNIENDLEEQQQQRNTQHFSFLFNCDIFIQGKRMLWCGSSLFKFSYCMMDISSSARMIINPTSVTYPDGIVNDDTHKILIQNIQMFNDRVYFESNHIDKSSDYFQCSMNSSKILQFSKYNVLQYKLEDHGEETQLIFHSFHLNSNIIKVSNPHSQVFLYNQQKAHIIGLELLNVNKFSAKNKGEKSDSLIQKGNHFSFSNIKPKNIYKEIKFKMNITLLQNSQSLYVYLTKSKETQSSTINEQFITLVDNKRIFHKIFLSQSQYTTKFH